MSARAFIGMVESFLVERYGPDAVAEWHQSAMVDEVAQRRRDNAVAALALGGEVV